MLEKKCEEEDDFEAAVEVSNKDMQKEEFCKIIDGLLENVYFKSQSFPLFDTRGLMVLGLIHCRGTIDQKKEAL